MKYGVFKNGYIKVGNTDLSDHCIALHGDTTTPGFPADGFGDAQQYQNPGIPSKTLTAKFLNDFASGSVFATLNPLVGGAVHVVQWRNDSGPVSVLNVTHSGLYFISSTSGFEGGDRNANAEVSVTWTPAGVESQKTT
jgi:hypothetical protein